MRQGFFMTGTDTGVGKTRLTTLLLDGSRQLAKRTVALKPVASGIDSRYGCNEDAYLLMRHSTIKSTLTEINPYCFIQPIAPSIAAKQEQKLLCVDAIFQACQPLLKKSAEVVFIEGVGGWNVPLNNQETMADLAKKFGFPVILVVGLRLGCLNHALLTQQAVNAAKLPFAGWIANQIDPVMENVEENIETLKHLLKIPFLGYVPFLSRFDLGDVLNLLDFRTLLKNNSLQS